MMIFDLVVSRSHFPARAGVLLGLAAVLAAGPGCAKKQAKAGGFSMPPTPVETAIVSVRTVADRFEAVGTVEAGDAIEVVTEVTGTLERLAFREGEPIRQGELIAQIDDDQLMAERDRAEALRDRARAAFGRVKTVVDQGAGAPQDLDDAAADLKVAEANLAVAQSRLDDARIVAPFSGMMGARRVSRGAYLRPGDAITELARIDELRVTFSTPERYLGRLNRGSAVLVGVTAYPGYTLEGTISVIDPVLDPVTRNAIIVALVKNPEGRFRPGMSANVSAVLAQRDSALTVPSEAVVSQGNQTLLYVVNPDSTVLPTPVTLGTRLADAVEVLSGVSAGTVVVSAGHQKLFPGAKVMPIPAGQKEPGK